MASTSDFLLLTSGTEAKNIGMRYWNSLSARERKFLLWDMEMTAKPAAFAHVLQKSVCGFAMLDDEPGACAWLAPMGKGCSAYGIHFSFAAAARQFCEIIGQEFLRATEHKWDCLTAFIPTCFRSARKYAAYLGFRHLATLPNACNLAAWGRICAGELLLMGEWQ